jgi:alpha-N-arabinofuranosidase
MAIIRIDLASAIGEVSPHIYGHFAEHLGANVYGGIFAVPGDRVPHRRGMRLDTLALIKALKPANIRWPGGCFSEYYHWEDGIGPVRERPFRFDWVWKQPEANFVGTHEFLDLCREVGAEPVVAVNARTGTPEEAAAWVRYCNAPPDDEQGVRRARNGHAEPFGVKFWDVGNESWDLGAQASARRFVEFNDAMKAADAGIKTVAVGSLAFDGGWNETMLAIAGDRLDFIAPHHYDGWPDRNPAGECGDYYANIASAWRIGETARRTCELLDEALPQRPEVGVSMDEWGIWIHHNPGLQHDYDLSDGLVAASVLNGFQRLCRRMKMANWAQLVNVLGAITADATCAWETPVATVFRLYANHCREVAVACALECGNFDVDATLRAGIPPLPYLDVSATRSADGVHLTLCVINRHRDHHITAELAFSVPPAGGCTAREMNAEHWFARNEPHQPRVVVTEQTLDSWPTRYTFPAHSLTVISG